MADPFTVHEGVAAPLMLDNVDTDQIIPSREMKAVSRDGLAVGLFAGWRYVSAGSRELEPGFVLNKALFQDASVLVAGENFGCGSSREHAVWALSEFGIRAIIAKSFGAIFRDNCVRNGILPVVLPSDDVETIAGQAASGTPVCIDLPDQAITCGHHQYAFEIDVYAKRLLVGGLDPIGLTQSRSGEISAFLDRDRDVRPWIYQS